MPCTSTSSRTIRAPDAFAAAISVPRSAAGVQQVWIIECDCTRRSARAAGAAGPSAKARARRVRALCLGMERPLPRRAGFPRPAGRRYPTRTAIECWAGPSSELPSKRAVALSLLRGPSARGLRIVMLESKAHMRFTRAR